MPRLWCVLANGLTSTNHTFRYKVTAEHTLLILENYLTLKKLGYLLLRLRGADTAEPEKLNELKPEIGCLNGIKFFMKKR